MTVSSSYELLVTGEDVIRYLDGRGVLGRLASDPAEVTITEVTAGNMNRVFIARGPLGSLAVKQAPPWVQVAGPDWPIDPGRIESESRAYELLAGLVPESIPAVEPVDLDRFVLIMEDLSGLQVLRDALVGQVRDSLDGRAPARIDFDALGRVVGRFSGELSFATSRAALGPEAHADLVIRAANPELCALTDAVVLDEPYREHEHNRFLPELEDDVRAMYVDEEILAAAAEMRGLFADRAEALIHGDLHSGSVMIGTRGDDDGVHQVVKVFDPEFGFVGPIGMDLGLFWANLALASIAARVAGDVELADARAGAIRASWGAFSRVLSERWPTRVDDPEGLPLAAWLERIRRDAWGFAGAESVRRVAGYAPAADLTSLPSELGVEANRLLLSRARAWLVDRADPQLLPPADITETTSDTETTSRTEETR